MTSRSGRSPVLTAAALAASALAAPASADLEVEWVTLSDGPERLGDYASALALDDAGNVYVCGTGNVEIVQNRIVGDDYITIKYDPSGKELWCATYDGPERQRDFAHDLAVDEAGNVYVTGSTGGNSGRTRGTTIKYDAEGTELWVVDYEGPAGRGAGFGAITLDSAGNVYVAGASDGGKATSWDALVVKYDGDGNEIWVARHDGQFHGDDSVNQIVIAGDGDVYAGGSTGRASSSAMLLVKFDTAGKELWSRFYDGPGDGNDRVSAIALGPDDDVYVTGCATSAEHDDDFATLRYTSGGTRMWVASYDGPSGAGEDEAHALVVDGAGNAYVTGQSMGKNGYDFATVKHDPDGATVWSARYDGPGQGTDIPSALAIDGADRVLVAGYSWGVEDSDLAVIEYDAGGMRRCAARYDGGAGDSASAIRLDAAGSAYVAGASDTTGEGLEGNDIVTIKYGTRSCPADVDGNGVVGFPDLVAVLAAWGNEGGPEDINGDGLVGMQDVIALLAAWGPCK